ncbi:MAG TPA: alpha/beta hydrolase [Verrucomicrobiae bacterium]|jgi:acetyl esterase/lipase|nr:alpha/beta hydrolase [Verrucomicrobiae bacterium]
MTKKLFASLALLLGITFAHAQMTNSFPLWPTGAPDALGTNDVDIPTLTAYLPKTNNGPMAAMVVCPGGGYGHLAGHEGKDYALWLNDLGIAGYVLKYRLGPKYHHPAMLEDAARALQTVRANASAWGLDPKRIGIIGSSAGGHLAATLSTRFTDGDTNSSDPIARVSSRPDIAVLCYPVITLEDPFVHKGSKLFLLGTNPPPELVQELSAETQVTSNTPPCFIWTTFEDKTVPAENSFMFAEALRKAHVPFDFHVYQHGPHGQGLGSHVYDPSKFLPWVSDCAYWLKSQKFTQ